MFVLIATLVLQAPVSGIILSDDPPAPVTQADERPIPVLPAQALSDPYGWERAQCSPYVRKDESLETCQFRVRSDLKAALGDQLPASLQPGTNLENCAPGTAEQGFRVQCAPRAFNTPYQASLRPTQCQTRPQRQANGQVAMIETCTHEDGSPISQDSLRIEIKP